MLSKSELQGLTTTSVLGGTLSRGLVMAGFLSKTEIERLLTAAVKTTIIAGGAAGDHTVAGIAVGDALRAVLHVDFTDASETGADITSEFTITGANTINNTGGTATTDGFLIVVWEDLTL